MNRLVVQTKKVVKTMPIGEQASAQVPASSDYYSFNSILNRCVYEIVLRVPQADNTLVNLNVLLVKMGLVECTDMRIYDGEGLITLLRPGAPLVSATIHANKQTKALIHYTHNCKPTAAANQQLERSIQELRLRQKIYIERPSNSVLCRVTYVESPSEIWVLDCVDDDYWYHHFQAQFTRK